MPKIKNHPVNKSVGNRIICKTCNLSFTRTHYYGYGHSKGLCKPKLIGESPGCHQATNFSTTSKNFSEEICDIGLSTETSEDHNDTIIHNEKFSDAFYQNNANENSDESSSSSFEDLTEEEDSDGELYDNEEELEIHCQSRTDSSTDNVVKMIVKTVFLFQIMTVVSDQTILALLGVIRFIVYIFATFLSIDTLKSCIENFPTTLYSAKKCVGLSVVDDMFKTWVVCIKCHTLYDYEDCTETVNGKSFSKLCSYVQFPNHPNASKRGICGARLLNKLVCSDGRKSMLKPRKTYCQRSIKASIQSLLKRPGFKDLILCQKHAEPSEVLTDICDGIVYRDFKCNKGDQYFKDKRNLATIINVDWFQPFKNSEYSLGVIYMAIINLPREVRFNWENIIVCGIIPGPKEPNYNINTYLKPIVDELELLWHGCFLDDSGFFGKSLYKVAVICLSSDIPATRKCGGFLGFSANKGCSKCWKEFPRKGFGEKADYSGFDFETFRPRYGMAHKLRGEEIKDARTKTLQKQLEKQFGVRYSELFRLTYYDPIVMHVIDPMHNLLLGTAKHMFKAWVEQGFLDEKKDIIKFSQLQKLVNIPYDYGRISKNVLKVFKSMKADEWKNFVMYYSVFCMKEFLPSEHYEHWLLYVKACFLVCKRSITSAEIDEAHECLQRFCKGVETLYGKEKCTPNMHLHLHLRKCMIEYGPVYGFWCFSFERFNGTLGSYHLNNKDIGITIMRKFCKEVQVLSMDHCLFRNFLNHSENEIADNKELLIGRKNDTIPYDSCQFIKVLSVTKKYPLSDDQIMLLEKVCQVLESDSKVKKVCKIATTFKRLTYANDIYASSTYCKGRNVDKYVLSKYVANGQVMVSPQPAIIKSFYKVDIVMEIGDKKSVYFAECYWLRKHPYQYEFGQYVEVWYNDYEKYDSFKAFVPITFFNRKYACVKTTHKFKRSDDRRFPQTGPVNFIIPLGSKSL